AGNDQWGPLVNNWVEGRTTGQSGQFRLEVVVLAGVPTLRAQIEFGPNRAQAAAPIDGTIGVMHHFAMTANGRTLSLFWDGVLVGSVDYLGNINAPANPAWISIGANLMDPPTAIPPLLSATVDDVAIW